jgi:cyclase
MKRIIFSLLFDSGNFILSRNFRRQRIGNISWLMNNYSFQTVSFGVDEILILNISPTDEFDALFLEVLRAICCSCLIPITAGGRVKGLSDCDKLFQNGADKIFLNSLLFFDLPTCRNIANKFGSQALVAGLNFSYSNSGFRLHFANGEVCHADEISSHIKRIEDSGAGELVMQSVDRDGTSIGLDLNVIGVLPPSLELPIVLMGGVGKAEHVLQGLGHPRIDGVATANLLNFIGNSLLETRNKAIAAGLDIPVFDLSIEL